MSALRRARLRRHGAVVVLVASLPVAAACGGDASPQPLPTTTVQAGTSGVTGGDPQVAAPGAPDGSPGSSVPPPEPASQPPAAPAVSASPPVRPVTIAFAGDIHAEGPAKVVATTGLGAISGWLSAADVAVVNLETAIVTSPGAVAEPKTYAFKTSPSVLTALADSGVDVASMANNHGLDYGRTGLADSVAAIAANPIPQVIGIGATAAQAWAPYIATAGGRTIGVIGATDVLDDLSWAAQGETGGLASAKDAGEQRLLAETESLAAEVDITVVFLHWGRELEVCPTDRQRTLAARLAEAGADIVAGSHAHIVQPLATATGPSGRSATVAYGLGNFAWYHSREPSSITGVLTVTVAPDDTRTTSWQPARIGNGVPVPEGEPVPVPVTGCA